MRSHYISSYIANICKKHVQIFSTREIIKEDFKSVIILLLQYNDAATFICLIRNLFLYMIMKVRTSAYIQSFYHSESDNSTMCICQSVEWPYPYQHFFGKTQYIYILIKYVTFLHIRDTPAL